MEFHNKYISTSNNTANGNPNSLTVLSDDAFAIGEMIEELAFKISRSKK